MCLDCKGLGKRITVDLDLLLDRSKSLREGAVTHPDYKVGGWNWREINACGLFDPDKPLEDFTGEEMQKLLYAQAVPITKAHGAGVYAKKFDGIVRGLERRYVDKSEDELPEARKNAYQRYFVYSDCQSCGGTRLNPRALSALLEGKSIAELSDLELVDLERFLARLSIPEAEPLVRKMRSILGHLIEIGVDYLSLGRPVSTLSGGESQRVKMARQLDCDLVDMMYILDEPTIGLHPKDTEHLVAMLRHLRDKGNSVLVVEHDPEVMRAADHVIDVGPRSGIHGGEIVFEGAYADLCRAQTVTAQYLRGQQKPAGERKAWTDWYEIRNASTHNLKDLTVRIPRGVLTCITGVAGSGKSSLINDTFVQIYPEAVVIDQSPAGKSSRSTPVTYIGVFDLMRKELARATGGRRGALQLQLRRGLREVQGHGLHQPGDELPGRYPDDVR